MKFLIYIVLSILETGTSVFLDPKLGSKCWLTRYDPYKDLEGFGITGVDTPIDSISESYHGPCVSVSYVESTLILHVTSTVN